MPVEHTGAVRSQTELMALLRSGDVPTTDEFAASLEEIQRELREGAEQHADALARAERRALLLGVLKRVETLDLPGLIASTEAIRRELGLQSILRRPMGSYL